jgi:plastocyanin
MSAVFKILLAAGSLAIFSGNAAAETHTIKMGSDKGYLVFEPAKLSIRPGDTIIWVNNKLSPHNVVFDQSRIPGKNKNLADSLSRKTFLLTQGQTVETRFPDDAPPGRYPFYCESHRAAGMTGVITVEEK